MKQYQATYTCICEDGKCMVVLNWNDKKPMRPAVCLDGKNISSLIENSVPKWQLKGQRFVTDGKKKS